MTSQKFNSQRGTTTFSVLLIVLGIIIAALIYILAGGPIPRIGKTYGTDATYNDVIATQPGDDAGFDGLGAPNSVTTYPLDEFGDGISRLETFNRDINQDGKMDVITRTHHESGTAHSYDEYKIELTQDGKLIDITPDGFRTVMGAECALQQLKFVFTPDFHVIRISRPWVDSWDTPSMATKNTYGLVGDKIQTTSSVELKSVCDVSDLF